MYIYLLYYFPHCLHLYLFGKKMGFVTRAVLITTGDGDGGGGGGGGVFVLNVKINIKN